MLCCLNFCGLFYACFFIVCYCSMGSSFKLNEICKEHVMVVLFIKKADEQPLTRCSSESVLSCSSNVV